MSGRPGDSIARPGNAAFAFRTLGIPVLLASVRADVWKGPQVVEGPRSSITMSSAGSCQRVGGSPLAVAFEVPLLHASFVFVLSVAYLICSPRLRGGQS